MKPLNYSLLQLGSAENTWFLRQVPIAPNIMKECLTLFSICKFGLLTKLQLFLGNIHELNCDSSRYTIGSYLTIMLPSSIANSCRLISNSKRFWYACLLTSIAYWYLTWLRKYIVRIVDLATLTPNYYSINSILSSRLYGAHFCKISGEQMAFSRSGYFLTATFLRSLL